MSVGWVLNPLAPRKTGESLPSAQSVGLFLCYALPPRAVREGGTGLRSLPPHCPLKGLARLLSQCARTLSHSLLPPVSVCGGHISIGEPILVSRAKGVSCSASCSHSQRCCGLSLPSWGKKKTRSRESHNSPWPQEPRSGRKVSTGITGASSAHLTADSRGIGAIPRPGGAVACADCDS